MLCPRCGGILSLLRVGQRGLLLSIAKCHRADHPRSISTSTRLAQAHWGDLAWWTHSVPRMTASCSRTTMLRGMKLFNLRESLSRPSCSPDFSTVLKGPGGEGVVH